ncbi:MAG: hypothetical protein ACLR06_10045 [Christensenellaceae bacterium]
MKVPVSSWRLEQIRLGQQDYEIFYLIGKELEKTDSGITAQQLVSAYGKIFIRVQPFCLRPTDKILKMRAYGFSKFSNCSVRVKATMQLN